MTPEKRRSEKFLTDLFYWFFTNCIENRPELGFYLLKLVSTKLDGNRDQLRRLEPIFIFLKRLPCLKISAESLACIHTP